MIGGTPISWSSRKQSIMALSSCEVEYVVTPYETCQESWIEIFIEELRIMEPKKMKLFVNNKSTINLENYRVCHGRSKYIERRCLLHRDQVNKGKFELELFMLE